MEKKWREAAKKPVFMEPPGRGLTVFKTLTGRYLSNISKMVEVDKDITAYGHGMIDAVDGEGNVIDFKTIDYSKIEKRILYQRDCGKSNMRYEYLRYLMGLETPLPIAQGSAIHAFLDDLYCEPKHIDHFVYLLSPVNEEITCD